ncbi:MAG: 2-polyprenylphenol 6-hydroxylase, partial [Ectothiorhodospiraceae bacterium AqS1]|nr:2-polyprenylphenol 6-hydroxylase [Ectothiorhodospiraceae bacterium AqS1]
MNLFRLATIASTTLRFGLDEIVARSWPDSWHARLWFLLFFWRGYAEPRGVRLRRALEALGPIFVKFGQQLSTRRDILPADIAAELAKLQDRVKPQPFAAIEERLAAAYERPLAEIFKRVEPEPLGSASVAQVHQAELLDGRTVAVKVLRPQIREQIERDLALMRSFAWLTEKFYRYGRHMKIRALVREFHKSLKQETNLLHEAANCNQIRRSFAGHPMLRIPEVHWDHCNADVMVMELLLGVPVDQVDELRARGVDLDKLAATGIEVFFTQVFRDSFFHADMHPGNIHVDDEGRFIVLDFGIMGSLEDHDKEYIGANFLAFFNRDYRRVAVMHVEAGWTPPDISITEFEAEIRAVCEPIFARPLQEISFGRLLLQLINAARKLNLIVQPQLILLQKTLLNVEGIGRQLAPELNLWDKAKPILEDWAKEQNSPKRVASILRENAPSMISLLPEIPLALRHHARRARGEGAAAAA